MPNVYKVYLECLETIFRRIFKNHIFRKTFFLLLNNRPNSFKAKKKVFRKNMIFDNASENCFQTLQIYFVDIWNVFQTQGYLSVTSEWPYDNSEEFYRRKTKSFHFLQKQSPIQLFVNPPKQSFWADDFFSKCCRKFSRGLRETFWVCKTFSGIRAIQRTLNQGRVTPRKSCGYPILIQWQKLVPEGPFDLYFSTLEHVLIFQKVFIEVKSVLLFF